MKPKTTIRQAIIACIAITSAHATAANTANLTFEATISETCEISVDGAGAKFTTALLTGSDDGASGVTPAYVRVTNNAASGTRDRKIKLVSIGSITGQKETTPGSSSYQQIVANDINVKYKKVTLAATAATDVSSPDGTITSSTSSNALSANEKFAVFAKIDAVVKAGTVTATPVIEAECL